MNFMEAVQAMKKGKKIRRKHWKDWNGFNLYNADGIGLMFSNNRYISDKISICDIEATDWEIVDDDKDWNLADNEGFNEYEKAFASADVKKCRNLCWNDYIKIIDTKPNYLSNNPEEAYKQGARDTIDECNKRFGDL